MKKVASFRKELFFRRLKIAVIVLVPLSLIIGAAFFIHQSPELRISGIDIFGNLSVSSGDIKKEADDIASRNIFGKILGKDHIFAWGRFPESELKERIFRLSDVKISLDRSSRKIGISVSERKEFLIWCLVYGEGEPKKCFWIDKDGAIFSVGPDAEGALIMVVNDHSGRELNIKDKPLSEDELKNFNKMTSLFDKFDWVVSDIAFKDAYLKELSVKLPGGQELFFDLKNDPSFGESVIRTLMESGEWPRIQYLDLRVEGKGFYRLN
ncbi:MAG: hypothetical protein PHG66_03825 [Candidatus Colwellbacteria bacterium]|nr:hypothetical protein [Candidatus Colwellbacteria bacterium]